MYIVHAILTIDLPHVHSLKGRRKIVNSIKDHFKNKNICVADVSSEYAKEAVLELLFFAPSQNEANNKIERIEQTLQERFSDIEFSLQYEIL